MIGIMTTDAASLLRAATKYRRAVERAERIRRQASAELTEVVRAAYVGGMSKSEILRSTGHVWSRTWLDSALKKGQPPATDTQ